MEMKINFNKLFEDSDSNSHTPSTTSLQNSYHLDEPSVFSTHSNNIDLHYKFNGALFFDSQATMEIDNNLNILEDLSSIGRSFDDSFEKQVILKSSQKSQKFHKQTTNASKVKKEEPLFTKQTFGFSQKGLKAPGQRLYYEHKINEERRLREVERMKIQKEEQQKKQITFKPAINQKSKKILELADSPLRKLNDFKKSLKQIEKQEEIKSTVQKKDQEDLKNCTFHPVLIKTPKNKFTLNSLNERRNADKVFEELYNDHKIKQMRRKQADQQLLKNQKKMTQEQLEQFLLRNEEYLQQKLHKEELMRAVSSQYDLSSGRKLFQPKINQNSETLFSSASVKKFVESSSSKKSEFILHDEQAWSKSKNFLKHDRSKSKKSRSRKQKKSRSSSKKQSKIESSKKLKLDSKNMQGPKDVKKDVQTPKNSKGLFKPMPYQVSKVPKTADQGQDRKSQPQQYEKPSSTIFSKIKATESVFEQKYEEEQQSNKSEKDSVDSIKNHLQSSKKYSQKDHRQTYEMDEQSIPVIENQKLGWQKQVGSLWNPYEDVQEQRNQFEIKDNNQKKKILEQQHQHEDNLSYHEQVGIDKEYQPQENYSSIQRDLNENKDCFDASSDQNFQQPQDSVPQFQQNESDDEQDQDEKKDHKDAANNLAEHNEDESYQNEESGSCQESLSQEEKEEKMKSSFLKSIESNPQINQKYQNLFELEHEVSHSLHESPPTQKESIHVSSSSDEAHQDQIGHIENFNQLNYEQSQSHSDRRLSRLQKNVSQTHYENNSNGLSYNDADIQMNKKVIEEIEIREVSPIAKHIEAISYSQVQSPSNVNFDNKISSQTATKKSWQEIFNSSTNPQQDSTPSHLPYSYQQKKVNQHQESPAAQPLDQSPKKKPINIASLLKGKKKTVLKHQQN